MQSMSVRKPARSAQDLWSPTREKTAKDGISSETSTSTSGSEVHPKAVEAFAEAACQKLREQGLLDSLDLFIASILVL